MALKNKETISALGQRLYGLMKEVDLDSPKELAKQLYARNLVQVKTRENFNSAERDRENAILSIEKKIVRHIKTGFISDQQGDYLLAYCKIFSCSADYLLGLTPIRSGDIEIRRMCELSGLSEQVIQQLVSSKQGDHYEVGRCWSLLMESPLFHSIPEDMVTMAVELLRHHRCEGKIEALKWEKSQVSGPDKMDIDLDIQGLEEELSTRYSSFYGMLSKISRNVTEVIERNIIESTSECKERYAKAKAIMADTKDNYRDK